MIRAEIIDSRSGAPGGLPDRWRPCAFWLRVKDEEVELYRTEDYGSVGVVVAGFPPSWTQVPVWRGVDGPTSRDEVALRDGVCCTIAGQRVEFSMPQRGLRRRDRRMRISVDDAANYEFRADGPPMSGRVVLRDLSSGEVIYRSTFVLDRHLVRPNASALELGLIGILVASNSRERVTRNPLRRV